MLTNPIAIELIRKLQIEEGNKPCFKTERMECTREECCWREICLDEFHIKPSIRFEVIE